MTLWTLWLTKIRALKKPCNGLKIILRTGITELSLKRKVRTGKSQVKMNAATYMRAWVVTTLVWRCAFCARCKTAEYDLRFSSSEALPMLKVEELFDRRRFDSLVSAEALSIFSFSAFAAFAKILSVARVLRTIMIMETTTVHNPIIITMKR